MYSKRFLLPAQFYPNLLDADSQTLQCQNIAMIQLTNAIVTKPTLLSVMSSLVYEAKSQYDSNHDRILVNRMQLQMAVKSRNTVARERGEATSEGSVAKAFATWCVTI